VPGALVWVITGVQVIPAYAESGAVGGTVRAFVGPVMAAMLWHLAMGIELRHHRPDAESHSMVHVIGRELRERFLSRLGIAERDRDAAQITRDRATVRAVALAARFAEKTPQQRGNRAGRRTARRLSRAVARASVGTDRGQRSLLLDQLAARRHAVALATVELPSPWEESTIDPTASALAAQTRDQMRQATEIIRGRAQPLFADVVNAAAGNVTPGHTVNVEDRSPEHDPNPTAQKLSASAAHEVIERGWAEGLTIRETAKRATRAPSYVHGVFVKLEDEHGPRPAAKRLALANGHDGSATGSPDN
jgi:hypothetical protein